MRPNCSVRNLSASGPANSIARSLEGSGGKRLFQALSRGLLILVLAGGGLSGCFWRDRARVVNNIGQDENINVPSDLENEATNVRITVPSGWVAVRDDRRQSADIYATYPPRALYTKVVSETDSVLNQFDLENNAEQYRSLIQRELDRYEGETRTGLTSLNGNPAVQYEIRGTVDNQPVVYLHTTVQGRDRYYQVVGWTTASSYRENEETLKAVVGSFRGT